MNVTSAKIERFTDCHVCGELRGSGPVIHGNDSLTGYGNCVKYPPFGRYNTPTSKVGSEAWPIIENAIAIQILADHDVERCPGSNDNKRNQPETMR